MPELPEVETIVRDLAPDIEGSRFRNPILHRPDVLRHIGSRKLLHTLKGARARRFYRRAKNIVCLLEDEQRLVIQLRMTGSLRIKNGRLAVTDRDYLVFQVGLGGGRILLFRDVRRLGTIQIMTPSAWTAFEEKIGPEPLADGFRSSDLAAVMSPSRMAIKKAIMDQRKLAGVGNIYANEALFLAGLDPSRPANEVHKMEYAALYRTIRRVLRNSIRSRGTTLRDYRTGTGEIGDFQSSLMVYGKGGKPCPRCGTELVTTHEIDGRSTTLCWHCQR